MSMLVLILRPSITTFLPISSQTLITLMRRSNCDAKVPIIKRLFTVLMICSRVSNTFASEAEKPARSELVESHKSARFLLSPIFSQLSRSATTTLPSSWTSLISPVTTTSPCLVSIATPIASGIEWVTRKVLILVLPTVKPSPSLMTLILIGSICGNSS